MFINSSLILENFMNFPLFLICVNNHNRHLPYITFMKVPVKNRWNLKQPTIIDASCVGFVAHSQHG